MNRVCSTRLAVAGQVMCLALGMSPLESSAGSGRTEPPAPPGSAAKPNGLSGHPLLSYQFTNELGRGVSLGQFRGKALAITFFFTRCPRPDFCPRLSKNFQEASQKLLALTNAPSNWHFISVTIDPEFDTPAVLKSYGNLYGYDPNHWTFLTGPPDKIQELAGLSQVEFKREGGSIDHNFRTLVIDTAGRLQMAYPVGGDLSDALVLEILRALRMKGGPADCHKQKGPSRTGQS